MVFGFIIPPGLAETTEEETRATLLTPVSTSLQKALTIIDQNLSVIASEFGETGVNSTPESLVNATQIDQSGWAGVILINGSKTYNTLNPSVITGTLNTSIAEDATIQDSLKYLKPKMSNIMDISDVDEGVVISRPTVVGENIGTAVALIIPWSLCEAVIRPVINGTDNLSVVMQGDGTILYTSHPTELTKVPPEMFMTEFATFKDVQKAMTTEKEGHMFYELWRAERGDPLAREAFWTTIDLHGTEWRVMIAEKAR